MSLKLDGSFRTSQAQRADKETLWVQLSHDGITGWGEAVPMDTYNQSLDSAEAALKSMAPIIAQWQRSNQAMAIESIIDDLLHQFDDQRATVAAVDAAMHDWIGKRFGVSVMSWLGLDPRHAPCTSLTIGIDDPETIAKKVQAASSFPIIKVKVGTPHDEKILSIIRNIAPDKTIRVDANMAWSVEEALAILPRLAQYQIELAEQPIPTGNNDGLKRLKEASSCRIVADESCVRPADVVALAGCVDGINIKLSKCGGIREAIRMIHLARAFNMKIMLGCMIESSLGIAAAAQLAPLADWLDLDGHLLLVHDPFTGLDGQGGRLRIGKQPGLGVAPR